MKALRTLSLIFSFILFSFIFATPSHAQLALNQCGDGIKTCGNGGLVCTAGTYCDPPAVSNWWTATCISAPEGYCEYQNRNDLVPYTCGDWQTRNDCGASFNQICPAGQQCKALYSTGPFYCVATNQCSQYATSPTPTPTTSSITGCGTIGNIAGTDYCYINAQSVPMANVKVCQDGVKCCTDNAPTAKCPENMPGVTPTPDPNNPGCNASTANKGICGAPACNNPLEECVLIGSQAKCQFGGACSLPTATPTPTPTPTPPVVTGNCGGWCGGATCGSNQVCSPSFGGYSCEDAADYCAYKRNPGSTTCGQPGTLGVCGNNNQSVCPYGKVCTITSGSGSFAYCKSGDLTCPLNQSISCGTVTNNPSATCDCKDAAGNSAGLQNMSNGVQLCCGWVIGLACSATNPVQPTPTPTTVAGGGGGGPPVGPGSGLNGGNFNALEGPTNDLFDGLNPLGRSAFKEQLSTPGGIISRILAFSFPLGGIALFGMLSWAGFEILIKAQDKNAVTAGRQRATAAIVGFVLLFCSYWMIQILEYVFGIHIM